jgi:hypothetical protein
MGIVIVCVWVIGYIMLALMQPKDPVFFEFKHHKELTTIVDSTVVHSHRYEVFHHEKRVGYVVLPVQLDGIETLYVGVE